jgi:hypothetical protein
MNNLWTLLIVALVSFLVGLAGGYLAARMDAGKTPVKAAAPTAEPAPTFRVESQGERIYLELDGKVYRSLSDLSPKERERLARLEPGMMTWLGKSQAAPPAASALAGPPVVSIPAPTPIATDAAEFNTIQPEAPSKPGPLDVIARTISPPPPRPAPPARSIAAQIDEILQDKLANSPLKSRGIRLLELPQKGMVVMIGLDQYDGVNAVPDDEIRTLLRACVEEWENKNYRG